ncbi:hypothetical protein LCGC14_3135730, partial [marine sediment metagenome]
RGAFAVSLPLGLDERGDWTVLLREPCTGKEVRTKVRLP